jgi:hypothetical protein
VGQVKVDFAAGDSFGTGSVSGLAPGSYPLVETSTDGFASAPDVPFDVVLGACDVTIPVTAA